MSAAIVILLLVGFALCVAVGLLTVLKNLLGDENIDDTSPAPIFQDRRAD